MKSVPSLAEATKALGFAQPPEPGLHLSLDGLTIAVSSNEPRIISGLADYFRPFVAPGPGPADLLVTAQEGPAPSVPWELAAKEPDPGKSKIKEEYLDLTDGRLVRKRLTGMVFVFGRGEHWAMGPCLANLNQVINFINNRQIQWELDRGSLLAHAAGVCQGGQGLALAGFSGMGKSTLALHLMSSGLSFVSNDRLLIKRENGGVRMQGVPKLPRINPGTALNNPDLAKVMPEKEREEFSRLSGREIWELEHKYDVDIEACFGPDRFCLGAGMAGLGLLNWQREGGELLVRRVDLAQRLDLLAAFKKSPGLFFLPPSPDPDYGDQAYLDMLAGVPVWELSGGVDFAQATARLAAELGWS